MLNACVLFTALVTIMEFFFEDPVPCIASGASDPMARDEEITIIKYVPPQHSDLEIFSLEIFFT